jgi:hypothetical protein
MKHTLLQGLDLLNEVLFHAHLLLFSFFHTNARHERTKRNAAQKNASAANNKATSPSIGMFVCQEMKHM